MDPAVIQAAAPIAEELIKDLFALFSKHAPAATVQQVNTMAQAVANIAAGEKNATN